MIAALGYGQILPNGFLVALALLLVFLPLFDYSDEAVPVARLAAVISTLQWLVGAALQYSSQADFDRYRMYVEEETYFQFAIPATCLFSACLIFASGNPRERDLIRQRNRQQDFSVGVFLLAMSTVAMLAVQWGLVSGSLAFLMNLIYQFRYIAALYFYFSRHRLRWLFVAACLYTLFSVAGAQAMFHDLIIWLAIYFFYLLSYRKRKTSTKVAWFAFAGFAVAVVQLAKGDYREDVWSGQNPSWISSAYTTLFEQGGITNDDLRNAAINRLNQGWIISAVMRHVPDREPFAGGKTIGEAIEGALLPRFLAPNKAKAGGQVNFRRFTGLPIADSTSMAISPLGESYANFGVEGGILFMMVWGSVFGGMIALVRKYSRSYPTLILWMPLFIYQGIKAETEFLTVFNQLSKGAVVAFGTYFLIHHVFLKNASILFGEPREGELPIPARGGLADIQRH